uniref:Retrotransposon gag domain-containing protein n=1 Tax=Brassica oleracea var. oleracea TaxID=109376 RepID=A0A0D2ZRH8_BRAOL
MKRGFLGSSKKKPADSRTNRKSTREESIDTLQATTIDSVNQKSIDSVHHQSIATRQTTGAVIPDVIAVAEMNYFDLRREWYDWVGQDPFQGLPHKDPRKYIEELKDLVSRSEQNEVSEYHMLSKIFSYSISGDAFSWFSQLLPGSLTSWDDIERVFLYKFLDDAEAAREKEKSDRWDRFLASLDDEYMISVQLLDDFVAKRDEHHDIVDSAQKNTDVSSCHPDLEVDREITMEDFLELEEFLELEDGEKLEELDSSREIVSGNPECATDASHIHVQSFEHSILLR